MKTVIVAVAAAVAVAMALFVGGEPPPNFAIDWERVEDDVQALWPAVQSLAYDADEDFVTVVVTDGTTEEQAAGEVCTTVLPVIHEAGSRALFAVYTEGGAIVASWNRCPLAPPSP